MTKRPDEPRIDGAVFAVIEELRASDYADLIPVEFLASVAALTVAAARPIIGHEVAQAIEKAGENARAYHYRAATTRYARLAREVCGSEQPPADKGHR
jgi:hypothetical protein